MAYGKNNDRKDWLYRAVPLGIGSVTAAKRERIFVLRERILLLMREMAQAGFAPEPLQEAWVGKELDARLLVAQKACSDLNSVWREQARMRVRPALEESVKRYFRRLAGSLRFVDQAIPEADVRAAQARAAEAALLSGDPVAPVRRYVHLPAEVQDRISPDEIARLKQLGTADAIAAFRQWMSGEHDFTPAQAAVLADIHDRALRKYSMPDFGVQDDFTLQLHVDARMLPAGVPPAAQELRNGVTFLLADDANTRYFRFLDLAGEKPREERIRLPLVLSRRVADRLSRTSPEMAALIVEISERNIGVRLVGGQAPPVCASAVSACVGRDFGYANTVSLSVAVNDETVDLDTFRADIERLAGKASVETFLRTHQAFPPLRIVERVRFSGRAFLRRVKHLCERIDGYKSRIDTSYNDLNAIRKTLATDLGLKPEDWITSAMKDVHPQAGAFFQLLGRIQDLKAARRALYRKIVAIKKAWFGMLSNVEITLARKYGAALVREDLTVLAIEKDAPEYKGKAFNKLLNNGSKGQYQKRASDKLLWNGIPEVVVPAWYTSRACVAHGEIVAKRHRSGERIYLPCCGRHDHADEHAGDTIASYPFLRPRLTGSEAKAAEPVCDTRTLAPIGVGSPVL